MHKTAYKNCETFFNTYKQHILSNCETPKIVDIGSLNVNGTLKPIFLNFEYIGIDRIPGFNVDIVWEERSANIPLPENSADVVVSNSCFEHDCCFWETFLEMCRIVKKGGFIYICAPSAASYHPYPVDCWRFYLDSWSALEKYARKKQYDIRLIDRYIDEEYSDKDSVGIFQERSVAPLPLSPRMHVRKIAVN